MPKSVKSEKAQAVNPDDVLRRMLTAPPKPITPKAKKPKKAKG